MKQSFLGGIVGSKSCRRAGPCDTGDGLITTALLLAAGAGTRLQPLTDNCPKCLTEVRGVPILGRLVSCLIGQGFGRLVVVVGYRDGQIRDYLESLGSSLTIDFVEGSITQIQAVIDRQLKKDLLREADFRNVQDKSFR